MNFTSGLILQNSKAIVRSALLFLIILVISVSCEIARRVTTYFPETGKNAIYQRALDLKSNLNILSIAIEPGNEDLGALAYYRMGKGAIIVSAYVTNGEAGESDIQAEYPSYLAAMRRAEAFKAISFLDGEVHFLNMPAIGAARDTVTVRRQWRADTLRARLARLIINFQPDIILVAPGESEEMNNPMQQVLLSDLLNAVKAVSGNETEPGKRSDDNSWDVRRIFVADYGNNPFQIPYDEKHPKWKKTYRKIGEQAARYYASLKLQRAIASKHGDPSYRLVYNQEERKIRQMEEALPVLCTPRLRSLYSKITRLTDSILNGKTSQALTDLVAIKDSVNIFLVQRHKLSPCDVRTLFNWNLALEQLHCSLLGVEVKYSISDTRLTARQITYLRFQDIKGISESGRTDILFSGIDQGWIINEDMKRRLPLKLHEKYRLVSPKDVVFNFPYGYQKIQSATEGTPYFFFIIHRGSNRENSFVYRVRINFSFGPRFVTEVLTPIVRMIPGEGVAIRLTNISRDGVADNVVIDHELASSEPTHFRLRTKESSFQDTLLINWKGDPAEGTYLIPIKIGGMNVANFAARKFHAGIDSSKKVGIVKGLLHSPVEGALRRLQIPFSGVRLNRKFLQQIDSLDVLIIDRRLLTLKPKILKFKDKLERFVNQGGHLIVLAQDASRWNTTPLWNGLQLTTTVTLDENIPIEIDSTSALLKFPNSIHARDWNDWLFRRAYNFISVSPGEEEDVTIPVKLISSGRALIVTQNKGPGKRTYVDLALGPQLMNIHPGAFRLLANLIAY